jgi:hypothetical protein
VLGGQGRGVRDRGQGIKDRFRLVRTNAQTRPDAIKEIRVNDTVWEEVEAERLRGREGCLTCWAHAGEDSGGLVAVFQSGRRPPLTRLPEPTAAVGSNDGDERRIRFRPQLFQQPPNADVAIQQVECLEQGSEAQVDILVPDSVAPGAK